MKKKILSLAIVLMMFMGVVSASSTNGDYKGNPIVNIVSYDGTVETTDVPAILYDDNIMIPASILRQLGAEVVWNEDEQSAKINFPGGNEGITVNTLMKILGENGGDHLLNYAQYLVNSDGYTQLDIYPNFKIFQSDKGQDLQHLLLFSGGVKSEKIRIDDGTQEVTFIDTADIHSYFKGDLSPMDFISNMKFVKKPSTNSTTVSSIDPLPNSSAIESTIEGEFTGWTGETIFKLSNGQIWQQESFAYNYTYDFMPKVLIYKVGSRYKMKVDGVKETIDVKQLK